ncbi:MAG: hypothetical protein ACTTID_03755 [Bacillales bacterium]
MSKTITVLGASGSVGKQVIYSLLDRSDFNLKAISIYQNIDELNNILNKFNSIKYIYLKDKRLIDINNILYKKLNIYDETDGIVKFLNEVDSDVYINSILGFEGLLPSLEILKNNKILLLANKETLVIGGELINNILKTSKGKIIPLDSEMMAVYKCIKSNKIGEYKNIGITASGGCFYDLTRDELKNVSFNQAITNPNWNMGHKITVDSNTLMNKTFEIIEASYLFDKEFANIDVKVCRSSMVHGFIKNNQIDISHIYKPSMLIPINYALELASNNNYSNYDDIFINNMSNYELLELDNKRFPILDLAQIVIRNKGDSGCILNAIDEVVVEAFLNKELLFYQIDEIIIKLFNTYEFNKNCDYSHLRKVDKKVREETKSYLKKLKKEIL